MRRLIMAIWIAAMLVLAACGGSASPTGVPTRDGAGTTTGGASTTGGPADAARAYLEASYNQDSDAIESLLCEAVTTDVPDAPAGLPEDATFDLSNVNFAVSNETGDTADVTISGTITYSVEAGGQTVSTDIPLTEYTLPMRNEDGWKVCPV